MLFAVSTLVKSMLNGIGLFIDKIIYGLISVAYQVFMLISKANLYNNAGDKISRLTERIYVILGIAMLFVLAYNIILLIINPDKVSGGGDKSLQGMFKNFIISVVILTVAPTVFNYMSTLQNNILDSQVLENIILGGNGEANSASSNEMGSSVATMIFSTFYHPIDSSGNALTYYDCDSDSSKSSICDTYASAYDVGKSGNVKEFISNEKLEDALNSKNPTMSYLPIISSVAGVVALMMFISYIFDVGVRVAKLAFYQIIAPIPIILRVTKPSGGMFSKWVSSLIKTYLQLFVRLITIYFAMFMIEIVMSGLGDVTGGIIPFNSDTTGTVKLFSYVMLILGIMLFAKEAPKLLEELMGSAGLGGGGFGLKDIKKKFSDSMDNPIGKPVNKVLGAGAGLTAGALGAGSSALRNNLAARLDKSGKYGYKHMDVGSAMQQGAYKGFKGGGINQFKKQGDSVYTQTYGYGKKQSVFGGKSLGDKLDDKYGKIYSNQVKEHAKVRNDEIELNNSSLPTSPAELSSEVVSLDSNNQNIAATSRYYQEAADYVDSEAKAKGFTLSTEERNKQIIDKLRETSQTTTNVDEKRAIDSYLKTNDIVNKYNSTVLSGNKDAILKVEEAARVETENYVKKVISDNGGTKGLITDSTIETQLRANASANVKATISGVNGDMSKINLSPEVRNSLNSQIQNQVQSTIASAGGISNITFNPNVESQIKAKVDGNIKAQIASLGGSASIALTPNNQVKLDGMKASFVANANNQINTMVDNVFTDDVIDNIRSQIKNDPSNSGLDASRLEDLVIDRVKQEKQSKFAELKDSYFDKLVSEQEIKARDSIVMEQMMDSYGDSEREKIVTDIIRKQTEAKVITDYLLEEEYDKQVESKLIDDYKARVTDALMDKTKKAEQSMITDEIKDYQRGLLDGTYTTDIDGKLDKKFNSEYKNNEELIDKGVKTKSAEDLAFDKIKELLKEQDKKDK